MSLCWRNHAERHTCPGVRCVLEGRCCRAGSYFEFGGWVWVWQSGGELSLDGVAPKIPQPRDVARYRVPIGSGSMTDDTVADRRPARPGEPNPSSGRMVRIGRGQGICPLTSRGGPT